MRERLSSIWELTSSRESAEVLPSRPGSGKDLEGKTVIARLIREGSPWPLLLSAAIHLILLSVCCVPATPKMSDFIMVDLAVSRLTLPGDGEKNGAAGSFGGGGMKGDVVPGEARGKQALHPPVHIQSPHREKHETIRLPDHSVSIEAERAVSPSHSSPEPATHPATGAGGASGKATTMAREGGGSGSGASSYGTAGGGSGSGGSGAGKGGGGEGGGSNDPIDGVLGAPGGPSFSTRAMPVYPPFARRIGKEGTVLLRLHLDGSGHLKGVDVLKKAGYGFDEAALAAARASSYRPATRHGRSIPCRALLPVKFELEE